MKLSRFFYLQLKRVLKNTGYTLLLLLFPLCLFLLSIALRSEDDTRIPVGLFNETDDPLTDTLCQKLLTGNDSLFRFYEMSSEEELTRLVQSSKIECGYLFRKPLLKELDNRHTKNLITVLVSEHTTCKGVLNELVYASLFEEYSLQILTKALEAANHLPFSEEAATVFSLPPVTGGVIEESYRSHLSGDTFTFEITYLSSDVSPEKANGTVSTIAPLFRGLTAVFLLLCGFLAWLTVSNDRKNGLYKRTHSIVTPLCMGLSMLAYLLPAGVISLLGLGFSGHLTALTAELPALLCYVVLLLIFFGILGSLIQSHTTLCAAFPMILLCTLIFTPVITDLSTFFPWIKVIRYALPTYYYLFFF